jgi:hypothetical protein
MLSCGSFCVRTCWEEWLREMERDTTLNIKDLSLSLFLSLSLSHFSVSLSLSLTLSLTSTSSISPTTFSHSLFPSLSLSLSFSLSLSHSLGGQPWKLREEILFIHMYFESDRHDWKTTELNLHMFINGFMYLGKMTVQHECNVMLHNLQRLVPSQIPNHFVVCPQTQ